MRKVHGWFAPPERPAAAAAVAELADARLQLAAIKVSAGDLGLLREAVALAGIDWRDLLMAAEYPRQGAVPPGQDSGAAATRQAEDLAEYQAWLAEPGPYGRG